MTNEISLWRENETMEVEKELTVLTNPVFLLECVKKVPETIDLLFTSSDT